MNLRFIVFIVVVTTLLSCNDTEYPNGKRYYEAYCGNCHMEKGQGLNELIPPLKNAASVVSGENLACIIRNGIEAKDSTTILAMPANDKLSEIEILNIVNYISNSWGNTAQQKGLKQIKEELKRCQ